jgi:hypothetical protein
MSELDVTADPRNIYRKVDEYMVSRKIGREGVFYTVTEYEHVGYPNILQFVVNCQYKGKLLSSVRGYKEGDPLSRKGALADTCTVFDSALLKLSFA